MKKIEDFFIHFESEKYYLVSKYKQEKKLFKLNK